MDGDELAPGPVAAGAAIELLSHYLLPDKPARTLEVLRIFLGGQADAVHQQLHAGHPVRLRRDTPAETLQLARMLQAQGFRLRILEGDASPAC